MKYYQMTDKILLGDWDGKEPAVIYKRSHDFVQTKTGNFLVDYENDDDGEPFKGSLVCMLDDEDETGKLPTFFMSPALISTKQFYQDLVEIGIDNIEVHPVTIEDEVNNRTIDNYVLLNVIGRISCAVMEKSNYESLNDEADEDNPDDAMNFINKLTIDASKIGDQDLFLVDEDTDCILVSERVYTHLINKGYTDIFFEEVQQV